MGALTVTLHPGGWLGGGKREGQGCHFLVGPFWGCRPARLQAHTAPHTRHPLPSGLTRDAKSGRRIPPSHPALYPQKLK